MPAPDLRLPDGSTTYSLDGLKALLAWNTQQVENKLLPQMDERLKPVAEWDKQQKQREQQQQLTTQVSGQMQAAASWPMFGALAADGSLTPFQTEVLAELQKDSEAAQAQRRRPTMTLREAYLEVKDRHQQPDKVRERVIAELQTPRAAPALGRQATDAPKKTGPVSTQDIARQVIAKAERGG